MYTYIVRLASQKKNFNHQGKKSSPPSSVSDQYSFNTDPDPARDPNRARNRFTAPDPINIRNVD